jgi:hypothetical protein
MIGMRRFGNILFALAAVLWLPMSAHCQLEKIPALKFLACEAASDCAGQHSDCDDAGCCPAENAQYKSNQIRVTIPSPDLLPLLPIALMRIPARVLAEFSACVSAAAPPEFLTSWQFVFRTALPPRAPSIAS